MRHCYALALLSLVPLAVPAAAAPQSAPSSEDMEARLAAILNASFTADGPGAAVIVTRDGQTLLHRGRGMADIEAGRSITADERYPVASITKMFTAATVAMLADEGRLSLDDPISKYLPGFPEPSNRATIRQLLNHSSGVADISKVPGWIPANRDRTFTTEQRVALIRDLKPKAEPGAEWEYNNSAYWLLGAIIEKVTGQPWQEAMKARIAKPLRLTSILEGDVTMRGYGGSGADSQPFPQFKNGGIAGPAGGLTASAADLATFVGALHTGKLLSKPMYAQAIAPAVLNDGTKENYGFGFRLGRLRGSPTVYQGGAMQGVRTETLYLPKEEIFVAILANSDAPLSQPRPLAERLAAAAMGQPFPTFSEVAVDLDKIRPLLGRYAVNGREFLVMEREGKLWFAVDGSSARPLRAFGDRKFFLNPEQGEWFEFAGSPSGPPVLRIHVPEEREAREAPRVGGAEDTQVEVDPAILKAYAGRYRAETDVEFEVRIGDDGRLQMVRAGGSRPLRALENGRFAIDGTPMQLEFLSDDGRVTGLRMFRGARVLMAERLP